MLGRKDIQMNFSRAPTADDLLQMALIHYDALPPVLAARCEDLILKVEEFPDETMEADLALDDPYDLLCLYKSARDVTPGVRRKIAQGDDILIFYRRPILDMWAETGDDLNSLLQHIMVNEISAQFDMATGDNDAQVQKRSSL